ncbi:hypothetical protein J6590_048534, partial [Homalodisca vitripennis]
MSTSKLINVGTVTNSASSKLGAKTTHGPSSQLCTKLATRNCHALNGFLCSAPRQLATLLSSQYCFKGCGLRPAGTSHRTAS